MKNCFACNEPLDDDAKFCIECRAKQPEKIIEPKEGKMVKKVGRSEQKTVPAKKSATAKPSVNKTTPQKIDFFGLLMPASRKMTDNKPAAKKPSAVKPKKKELTPIEEQARRMKKIYEMTDKDDCGRCKCDNCRIFAMKAASPNKIKKLTDCPFIDKDEAEEFYNSFAEYYRN